MHTRPVTYPLPSPAAGTDFSYRPSQTDQAVVMTLTAKLTTSATVAGRLPALTYTDQNGEVYLSADLGQAQAASLAVTYTWARMFGTTLGAAPITGQKASAPLPDAWLQPNDTISVVTANLDPADQWSNIMIRYYTGERWLALQRELRLEAEIEATLGS